MNGGPLSKENFWDEIEEKYPEQLNVFTTWLSEYKQRVNWDDLFLNTGSPTRQHYFGHIKFHHLPVAMQIGIFAQFIAETDESRKEFMDIAIQKMREHFKPKKQIDMIVTPKYTLGYTVYFMSYNRPKSTEICAIETMVGEYSTVEGVHVKASPKGVARYYLEGEGGKQFAETDLFETMQQLKDHVFIGAGQA